MKPTDNKNGRAASNSILVVGAGVSGLTSALCLRRKGFDVTVLADRFAPQVTSIVAGALWEWPPAICGHHNDRISLARSKAWCETSYRIFAELAGNPATGVYIRQAAFYFKRPVHEFRPHFEKMTELATKVRQFRHDPALIAENGVCPALGLRDAYAHLAPMIDTDTYMKWLLREVRQAGCRVVERKITGLLREQQDILFRQFGAAAIVNCAGLGARELTGDPVRPLRGALIRVRNDGERMPRITQAHCVTQAGVSEENGFIFIVPRGDDLLVLGGIAELDECSLDIGLNNYEPIREMHRRCLAFMPILKDAEIDAAEPVRVGLRPYRRQNVRVELEQGTRIVHNYGHGGSGVTFSWGCAFDAVELVESLIRHEVTDQK